MSENEIIDPIWTKANAAVIAEENPNEIFEKLLPSMTNGEVNDNDARHVERLTNPEYWSRSSAVWLHSLALRNGEPFSDHE